MALGYTHGYEQDMDWQMGYPEVLRTAEQVAADKAEAVAVAASMILYMERVEAPVLEADVDHMGNN